MASLIPTRFATLALFTATTLAPVAVSVPSTPSAALPPGVEAD